ncbi:MAG TPA: BMP family ABC transporter substrate-binding protein [Anaeromyxobacter sp.]|nr:BMP family ABC transporter substrate-binding protein [Anaeromyxobacter sp.]
MKKIPFLLASLLAATAAAAGSIRVGLVTDVGGIDDKSFNQGTWDGIRKYGQENGAKEGKDVKYLQSTAEADYVPNLSTFADEKLDLIVAPGFLFTNAMVEVATKYPQQKFLLIDSVAKDKSDKFLPNVVNAVFAEHEGSFLVGVVAGLRAKADKKEVVGFVGGMQFPLIEKFQAGFEQGVRAVHPSCKILVDYAGEFGNPGKGQALAAKQFGAGAYVVFHAAGGTGNGVIKEAKERTQRGDLRWAIGVDKDQYADGLYAAGKSAVLTSMMKRVDVAAHDVAVLTRDGKFPGGQLLVFALKNKGVGLPAQNPNVGADILAQVADYEDRIASGKLQVSEVPAKK